jgi:nicotinate-nucleotide pyrophosphorylase (carboxylating)
MSEGHIPALPDDLSETVRRALAEDIGSGDVTAHLVPAGREATAVVVCREPAVLCGSAWFDEVFAQLEPRISVKWRVSDGATLAMGERVCTLTGPAATMVTGERTALNFLQLLSGTASMARRYADAVAGTGVRLLDTRKTVPGLRRAQKYAVRCGGCYNHRMGLFDAVLIKDNHITAAGSIERAVAGVKERHPGIGVEVEVEDLRELESALGAGADIVMLDNFDLPGIREAVDYVRGRVKLEVSGNVEDLDALVELAATGVDFISIGALTKHVRAIDFSMGFEAG